MCVIKGYEMGKAKMVQKLQENVQCFTSKQFLKLSLIYIYMYMVNSHEYGTNPEN